MNYTLWYIAYDFSSISQIIKVASPKIPPDVTLKTEIAESKQHRHSTPWTKPCPDCDQTFASRAHHQLHICLGKFSTCHQHFSSQALVTNIVLVRV